MMTPYAEYQILDNARYNAHRDNWVRFAPFYRRVDAAFSAALNNAAAKVVGEYGFPLSNIDPSEFIALVLRKRDFIQRLRRIEGVINAEYEKAFDAVDAAIGDYEATGVEPDFNIYAPLDAVNASPTSKWAMEMAEKICAMLPAPETKLPKSLGLSASAYSAETFLINNDFIAQPLFEQQWRDERLDDNRITNVMS